MVRLSSLSAARFFKSLVHSAQHGDELHGTTLGTIGVAPGHGEDGAWCTVSAMARPTISCAFSTLIRGRVLEVAGDVVGAVDVVDAVDGVGGVDVLMVSTILRCGFVAHRGRPNAPGNDKAKWARSALANKNMSMRSSIIPHFIAGGCHPFT